MAKSNLASPTYKKESIQHILTTHVRTLPKCLRIGSCLQIWTGLSIFKVTLFLGVWKDQKISCLSLSLNSRSLPMERERERNESIHNPGHMKIVEQIKVAGIRIMREKVFTNSMFKKKAYRDMMHYVSHRFLDYCSLS